MSEELYRVILKGYSTDKGQYYIEVDFAELFKITQEKAKKIFKSCPAIVKENLSFTQANKYQEAIEKTGAVCEVESMKYDTGGLSLQ